MQQSAENILSRANTLVQSLSHVTRDNLCAAEEENRQLAVNTILKKLNPQANPEDNTILQSLPIALMASGEHIGTMYFMLICIENGAFFDPKIIDAVISAVALERIQCSDDGDIEATRVINQVLHSLYNSILRVPEYQKIPEIYLSIGMDQERNGDTIGAIGLYNEALGLASIESYMYLGDAYESKFHYDMSTIIFDYAYQLSGETRFLHRLIHALCKSGKREEAYTYYTYLSRQTKDTINPFVVYLEDVHNDRDLDAVSQLMTDYYLEGILGPSNSLTSLAINSSVYISSEIEKESSTIAALNEVSLDVWTDEYDSEYWRAISRRLYLMQTHIITLADPRYLEFYIDEMRRYTIDGNSRTQEMIRRFFTDSFSPYVLASYRQATVWDAISDLEAEGVTLSPAENRSYQQYINELENTTPSELYESMRLHLTQISTIFLQHSFYEIMRDTIVPFIEACLNQEGELDEEIEQFHGNMIQELKNELDEYDRCSPVTRRFYEEYIEFFDQKYGMFYRRYFQLIVRDDSSVPASLRRGYERVFATNGENHIGARNTVLSNMSVFQEYPDIALLFLIEKIIAGQDIIGEDETIDTVAEKYQLYTLTERDAILFAALLYERGESHDDAMDYIVSIPDILDVPQVLSMLMEWLRYMDDSQRIDTLLGLDQVIQTEYDAKDFFEQVEIIADDTMNTGDASDADQAYMLMAIAHMGAIRGDDVHEIQRGFTTAGIHGLSQGYIATGDISRARSDFDEAIVGFKNAYLLQPDIVSLHRLIGCLIEAARFDEAHSYIDIALREGYNVSGYIFAWHLYQGQVQLAIEQMVRIVQSDGYMDMTMPEGCMELLSENIDQLLADTTSTRDAYELKILASYIDISMAIDSDEPDPANIIIHIDYIDSLMNSHEGDDLIDILYRTLCILVSDIDLDHKKSNIDALIELLHLHYTKLHTILEKIHIKNQNKKDADGTKYSFEIINELIGRAMLILQRFPQTEEYLRIWRGGLNLLPTQHHLDHTIHAMSETVQ